MSFAICFNLDQSKILSFGNGLMLYPTIPTFNVPKNKALENTVGKGENAFPASIFSFSTVFSTQSRREINILATLNLSSSNAFILFMSKFLLFGKETGLRSRKCQSNNKSPGKRG